jgi:uncharacterized protein (TIRG00374 family)
MQPNTPRIVPEPAKDDLQVPTASAGEAQDPPSLGQRLRQPKTLISFVIAAFVIFLLVRGLDISFSDVWEQIKQADKTLLLMALGTYYLAILIRSVRWRMMLEKVVVKRTSGETIPGVGSTWQMLVLSLFVNCIVPARLGDAYRSFLLKDRNRISFGVSFGTILAERLIDLIVMVGVVLVAGIMVFGTHAPGRAEQTFLLGLGVVVLGIIGTICLYLFRHRIESRLPSRFTGHYQRLNEGIFSILSRPVPYLGMGVVVWLLDGLRVWLVVKALGAEITLAEAVVVSLLSALVTIIPFTPAGVGFVEGFMIWILPQFGIARSTAVAIALIDRSITFLSLIVVGIVVYLLNLRRGSDRDFREAERQELQHEAS